jgi:hypothetical protein
MYLYTTISPKARLGQVYMMMMYVYIYFNHLYQCKLLYNANVYHFVVVFISKIQGY